MDLFLQFGYGMMDHCRSLISAWGGGTAILSPRDLTEQQLLRLAGELCKLPNGAVLLDPQFYLPHADHERLTEHTYWPQGYQTSAFWTGPELRQLLGKLLSLNNRIGAREFILPGLYASRVDDDWLARQRETIREASALKPKIPLLATIAIGADATKLDDDIHNILADVPEWDVNGVYLVCEHPGGEYLVSDPGWLANVLDLVSGLRLHGKRVILGYCNHQLLIAACARANAIASGTWMNVRSFPPEKFKIAYDDEIKQRAIWYYCPQALSEYKIPFLDIALKQGILGTMAPDPNLGSRYADILFSGPQPSSIGFTEQAAFRHYLQCLREQVRQASRTSFTDTCKAHEGVLTRAESVLAKLQTVGVRGQLRDFREIIDVNRAALSVLQTNRAARLTRAWSNL